MAKAKHWHLVGDIGGTNARFGLVRDGEHRYESIATYQVANYPDFGDVLSHVIDDVTTQGLADTKPERACFAVAAPPDFETIAFTNSHWRFDRALVAAKTGVQHVHIMNDFAAVARALPALTQNDMDQIGSGRPTAGAPMVALGPGTGFGVAGLLTCHHGTPTIVTGEGGHVDFAPVTDVEASVLDFLRARYGRVSIERLCCGEGIVNIYQGLANHRKMTPVHSHASAIGQAAQTGDDPLARETLAMFFAVLGASAGNFALTFGARGGVYIAGGIAPRYLDFLRRSDFRARFLAKGRYADYLSAIPTYIVTHGGIGLLGATLALED